MPSSRSRSVSQSNQNKNKATSSNGSRKYDIVVFGATGHTGKLVAEYYAQQYAGTIKKFAIAGRSAQKLATVAAAHNIPSDNIIVADSSNPESLNAMCASCNVLINCVGPFRFYGEAVVRACLEQRCETAFIRHIIDTYHEEAKQKGVLMVPAAGWDCVPSDMGALFTENEFKPANCLQVNGYFRTGFLFSNGRMSNGTYVSMIHSLNNMGSDAKKKQKPKGPKPPKPEKPSIRLQKRKAHFTKKLPGKSGVWTLPLAVADPWVVKKSRSMMIEEDIHAEASGSSSHPAAYHGNQFFSYGHYAEATSSYLGILRYYLYFAIIAILAQFSLGIWILQKLKGPDNNADPHREGVSAIHTLVGLGYSDDGSKRKQTVVAQVLAPEVYVATAVFVIEAAQVMLTKRSSLKRTAGVYPPAAGLGMEYVRRLNSHSPVKFVVQSKEVDE